MSYLVVSAMLVADRLRLRAKLRRARLEDCLGDHHAPRAACERRPEIERFAARLAGILWRRRPSVCLARSVALHRALSRLDAWPELVVGFNREERGELGGHAWVEVDGRALLESGDPRERWAVVVTYGPDGRRLA